MLETIGIVLLFVSAGILLFLPTIAINWWQSRDRPDRERDHHNRDDSDERVRE